MNKAKIVRKGTHVYLKVIGKPLDRPIYFEIMPFANKDKLKEDASLTKIFDINLSGRR